MLRTTVTPLAFAAVALLASCNQILGSSSYYIVGSDAGAPSVDGGGNDASPGVTCITTPPRTKSEAQAACTDAECQPFDNGRIPLYDGGTRPRVPAPVPDPGDDGGTLSDAGLLDGGAPRDAGVLCSTLPGVVYATGSSGLQPLIGTVAQVLEQTDAGTVVYQNPGSCAGVSAILDPASNPMRGNAIYWNPASPDPASPSAQQQCTLDPVGVPADVGISDVFAPTCAPLPLGLPSDVVDTMGPIQVMDFVVPVGSRQRSISADAAYFVYGFGAAANVAPWTDNSFIFQRSASSGTQDLVASALQLAPSQWKGTRKKTTGDMLDALTSAGQAGDAAANAAVGIMSAAVADDFRDRLRVLAFQDFGQKCGYWPDSTATSFDKRNVRDGHYPIWGPSHFFTRTTGGLPAKPAARLFAQAMADLGALRGVDLIDLYARRHVIPLCAMRVSRTSDRQEYEAYRPPQGCGCYFELRATGTTTCTPCSTSAECPASSPNCNLFGTPARGYCEP